MEALLGLPSHDPTHFSAFSKQSNRSVQRKEQTLRRYIAIHEGTEAPAHQVIRTEAKSVLVREFEQMGLQRAQALGNKRTGHSGPQSNKRHCASSSFEGGMDKDESQ
ncbi:hypothetical protein WJX84_009727 [Apatococcus fuscideae]|uniref:DET1- and DDB1-associated protein 1 domain-containing protein n=1 Tax=Apatococcus fuscideae TaxID=2026836 RepID=A0AAW1TEF7_9CHLO